MNFTFVPADAYVHPVPVKKEYKPFQFEPPCATVQEFIKHYSPQSDRARDIRKIYGRHVMEIPEVKAWAATYRCPINHCYHGDDCDMFKEHGFDA